MKNMLHKDISIFIYKKDGFFYRTKSYALLSPVICEYSGQDFFEDEGMVCIYLHVKKIFISKIIISKYMDFFIEQNLSPIIILVKISLKMRERFVCIYL